MIYNVFLIPGWPDKMNCNSVTSLEDKLNKYAANGWRLNRMNGPLAIMEKPDSTLVYEGNPCDCLAPRETWVLMKGCHCEDDPPREVCGNEPENCCTC